MQIKQSSKRANCILFILALLLLNALPRMVIAWFYYFYLEDEWPNEGFYLEQFNSKGAAKDKN